MLLAAGAPVSLTRSGPKQAALLGTCNNVLSTGRRIAMFTNPAARRGFLPARVARGAQVQEASVLVAPMWELAHCVQAVL